MNPAYTRTVKRSLSVFFLFVRKQLEGSDRLGEERALVAGAHRDAAPFLY